MFCRASCRTRRAVPTMAMAKAETAMRMIRARIETRMRFAHRGTLDSARTAQPNAIEAAIELVGLSVLVHPDRNRVEAARRIASPGLEHGLDRWILVHADAGGSRTRREGPHQVGPVRQDGIAQWELIRPEPGEERVFTDRL